MSGILKLTPRRLSIYDFILKFKRDHDGIAPTVLEIRNACGISSTSIVRHDLDTLILLGMIEYDGEGKSRMIRIPGAQWLPLATSPVTQAERVRFFSSFSK